LNFDGQFVLSQSLVGGERKDVAPGRAKDASIEAGLGSGPILEPLAIFVLLGLRFPGHVLDLQVLEDKEAGTGINDLPAGLVSEVLASIALILVGLVDQKLGTLPTVGTFCLSGHATLVFSASLQFLIKALFDRRIEVEIGATGTCNRNDHATVETGGNGFQVFFWHGAEEADKLLLRKRFFLYLLPLGEVEREPPFVGMASDTDTLGCGEILFSVQGVADLADRMFGGAKPDDTPHSVDRVQLTGDQDRLPAVLTFELWSAA